MKRLTALLAILCIGCLHISAAWSSELDRLKARLQSQLGAEVTEIKRLPVPGWYEVNLGTRIFYSDQQGRYLLVGHLIDLKTDENLTAARLAGLNRINFTQLPLANAIKVVKGKDAGKNTRQIAVFSDPNCPYCRQLEKSLAQLDNLTIYTFLYPVLSSDSMAKAQAIWCAVDRSQAWQDWIRDKKLPNKVANRSSNTMTITHCDTSVLQKNIALGRELNITGTPTLFFSDGRRLTGAVPAKMLEKELIQEKEKRSNNENNDAR